MNRKIITTLLVTFTLFTIYNTLIPFVFDYGLADLPNQISKITWKLGYFAEERVSLTDIAGNIILFMPFGFLMFMYLDIRGRSGALVTAVIASAVLSLGIETIQLFIQSRNTALHDLLNNTMGGFIGAFAAMIYARQVSSHARHIFYNLLNTQPFTLVVVIIGLAQTVAAAMPFSVSITVSHFLRSVKKTNLIPFSYKSFGALFLNRPSAADLEPFDPTLMIADFIYWIPVGYLLYFCYELYWKDKAYGSKLLIGIPLLFFPFLEGMQLFIISRTTDVNELISGWAGIAAGYLLYKSLADYRRGSMRDALDIFKVPLMIYFIFILFIGFRPFDWSFSSQVIGIDMTAENLIPFYAYFRVTSLWNIFDLATSLTYFLPISLYWSYRLKQKGRSYAQIYPLTIAAGLAVGALIEGSQLLSLKRIAEITDILAYGGGGALGTFALFYLETEIKNNN